MQATTKYKRTPKGVLTVLYSKMRERTKQKGLPPMDFTLQDFHKRYLNDNQFLLLHQDWVIGGYDTYKKPSIDRKDNHKGYTKDNIQMMTWEENRIKGERENSNYTTPVIMFNKSGEKIAEFESIKEAVEQTGFSQGNISSCCQGRREYTKGYKFQYRGDRFRKKPELLKEEVK